MALGAISEVWKTAFASELTRSGPRTAASTARGKGGAASGDHGHPTVNQVLRQPRQAVILIVGPAILDRHVPALHVTHFIQAEMERAHDVVELVTRGRIEETNDRHPGLLRARHERPRSSTAEICSPLSSGEWTCCQPACGGAAPPAYRTGIIKCS